MKRIMVTGAGGYIGRHVVHSLVKAGAQVLAVDINEKGIDEKARFIRGDIFDPCFSMDAYLGEFEVCLHLAWRDGFNHNAPSHMADLSAHYLFLKKLIDAGVSQIAVMGSMHEVGYWEGMVSDATPCDPLSFYGVAKDALRKAFLLEAGRTGITAQWLRGFYIYGDDEKSQSIFGKILRAASAGEKSFPFTTGKNKYDFISVDGLAAQIAACVQQDAVQGIINCCSGVPISLAEQVERFIGENGLDIRLEYGVYPERPYDSPALWGDDTKIKSILARG